jgi:3-oxoacyl-[acyl-carrier protein] reductase
MDSPGKIGQREPSESRVAVITGGASGIGQALAVAYAEIGVKSVVGYFPGDPHDPQETLNAVSEAGGECLMIEADVRSTASCDALVDAAISTYGRLDAVVANAGILRRARLADMTDSDWDDIMSVDFAGVMKIFRAGVKHLTSGAALVAVSSQTGGVWGWTEHAHYAAAKSGILGFVRSVADELGPLGIRANTVLPGVIETPQSLDLVNSLGKAGLDASAQRVPLRRVGTATEVARVIRFLTGPESSYITGAEIRVDGGITISQPT